MKLTKSSYIVIAVLVILSSISFAKDKPLATGDANFWNFEQLSPMPVQLEQAAWAFDGDNIVAIGGYRLNNNSRKANLDIYAYSINDKKWRVVGEIQQSLINAAAVSTPRGIACIGGRTDGKINKTATLYNISENTVISEKLPQLELEIESPKAVMLMGYLYLAGYSKDADDDGKVFLRLNMLQANTNWQHIPAWQGQARTEMVVAAAAEKLYLFSGLSQPENEELFDAYEYTPNKGWISIPNVPFSATRADAASCGEAHILFAATAENASQIFAYHAITRRYLTLEGFTHSSKPTAIVGKDTDVYLISDNELTLCKAVLPSTKYGWADHSVVFIFMLSMLFVGFALSKREKNSEDYFRGGSRVPWWATGLSMFATGASAISLMAMPGKAFATNWVYMAPLFFIFIIQLPISILIYMPIARRLKVSTANDYLERRFNLFMRLLAGVIWSALQILGRMSAIMLLPAIALSSIAGMPIETSILIMGVITTIYVFLGGLEGVIWTDVLQAIVMIGAVVICAVWALFSLNMDTSDAIGQIQSAEKLHIFEMGFDITRATFFIMMLNTVVSVLGQIGDQNYIQRVQCTSSEKEAKKAIVTQLAVAVPLNIVLFSLGTILFLYYTERPEMLSPATKADGVFPLFAAQNLPAGLAGLVVAAILAATMSTLSSALNSTANIGVEDFYRRLFKSANDQKCFVLGKIITAGLGIFGTLAALILANTKLMSIWDLFFTILGMLMGGISGVFILGIFTRTTNSAGAIIGAISSLAVTIYLQKYTHVHFFMFPVFGMLSCIIFGYLSSLLIKLPKKDLTGLTAYTLEKSTEE